MFVFSFGPHKFARILGVCLEYRSSFTDSAETPAVPSKRARSNSYGFLDSPQMSSAATDSSPGSEHTVIPPKSPQLPLRMPAPSLTFRQESRTSQRSTPPEPVNDLPGRSVVLLVEDNPVNMKVILPQVFVEV
jgi:hypothetical protein